MDQNENQNTNQQPNTQPADNGDQGNGKLFTQEEVNNIVRDRLARERSKNSPQEPTEEEKRIKDLDARESKIACREYIMDQGLPSQLLDVLDTSNHEDFKAKAEIISGLFGITQKPVETDTQRELNEYKIRELQERIAKETGIPDYMAYRLTGADERAMRADARRLKDNLNAFKGADPSRDRERGNTDPAIRGFEYTKHTPKQYGPFTDFD